MAESAFDYAGAKAAGYSDQEIAEYLASQNQFDLSGAINAGYGYDEVVNYLVGTPTPTPEPPTPSPAPEPTAPGIIPQLTAGLKSGVEQVMSAPDRVGLAFDSFTVQQQNKILDVFRAIDEGADPRELYRAANAEAKTFGPVELGQFINYQQADEANRTKIREGVSGEIEEARQDILQTLPEIQRRDQEAQEFAPRVPGVTDIRSLADFRDWLSYSIGSGGAQLIPVMGAAAIAGPAGALTLGTGLAGAETINNRLAYIQEVVKDLSPEEQATAISEYLYKTNDTSTLVALASGALDLAGPVGSILKRQLAKEIGQEVLQKSAGEAVKETLKEVPREMLEEGLTGGAQEIAQITGQRVTGEQAGDILSGENVKRVVDAAAAEAAGSLGGTTARAPIAGVSQAVTNATNRAVEKELSRQAANKTTQADPEAVEKALLQRAAQYEQEDPSLGPVEALKKASDDALTGNLLEPTVEQEETVQLSEEVETDVLATAQLAVEQGLDENGLMQYKGAIEDSYGPDAGVAFEAKVKELSATPREVQTTEQAEQVTEQQEVKDTDSIVVNEVQNDLSPDTAGKVIDEATEKVEEGQSLGEAVNNATAEVLEGNTVLEDAVAQDGLPPSTKVLKNTGQVQVNPDTGLGPKGKRGRPPIAKTPEQIKFAEEARKETKKASVNNKRAMDRGQKAWDANYEDAAFKRAKITREEYSNLKKEVADLKELQTAELITPAQLKQFNAKTKRINRVEDALRTEQANSQAARQESLVNALKILKDPRYKDRKPATGTEKKAVWQRAEELLSRADVTDADRARAREALEREEAQGTVAKSMPLLDSTNTEPNPVLQEEGITLEAALDSILQNGNPFEKLLIRRIKPFLKDINLVVVRDIRALPPVIQREFFTDPRGVYSSEFNTIYLALDGTDNTTLLHEAVHAATVDVVDSWLSNQNVPGMTAEQLDDLMIELQAQMDAAAQHYAEEKTKGRVSQDLEYLVEELDVLTDVKEFLAYGITQPEMQEFLAGVEAIYVAKKNFIENGLTKFINSIAKLFGFKGEQALNGFTSLMDLTDRLLLQLEVVPRPSTSSINQARTKKKKLTQTGRKLAKSRTASEAGQNLSELAAASMRGETESINLLLAIKDALSSKQKRLLSGAYTTTGLSRILNKLGVKNTDNINNIVEDMGIMRSRRIKDLASRIPKWEDFIYKFQEGGAMLADVMHMATLLNFDPSKHGTLNDALQNDAQLKELRKARQAALKNPNLTPGAVNAAKAAVTRRENEIKEVWNGTEVEGTLLGGWSRLQEDANGGQRGVEIYNMAKKAYQDTFNEHQELLLEKVRSSELPDDKKELLLANIVAGFQEAKKLEVYFPLMRYGQYWIRAGSGQQRQFYLFESEVARNNFARQLASEMSDTKTYEQLRAEGEIDVGINTEGGAINSEIRNSSQMLKDIFGLLDQSNVGDIEAIKDQVYQMYLMTLPEADIRKRFAHRKGIAGFNTDALRNFVVSQTTSANQLARLKYSADLRNTIAQAYAELVGRPDADSVKIFLDELAARAIEDSTPNQKTGLVDSAARLGNKVVFYWLLSAPKSALLQLTQLPIVGSFLLISTFGVAATSKVTARYTAGIFQKLGIKRVYTDENGDVQTEWTEPSMINSSYIQNNPDPTMKAALEAAWNYAADRDLFMSTYAADMTAKGQMSTRQYTSGTSRMWRGMEKFMSGAFHHTERINREIMYMSSFELAYNDAKQRELSDADAQAEAQKRALDLTYEGLFNYTNYNKPRFMKSTPLGRVATQFLTYPLMMTSYLFRNAVTAFGLGFRNPGERRAAFTAFMGTMMQTALFGGTTAILGYSFLTSLADGILNMLRPDFEEADEDEKEFWYGDPFSPLHPALSTDLWFRTVWLPDMFGPGSDFANVLGLSDETAEVIQRSAELGPISALTDYNIGASTSLDGLWFRDDVPKESLEAGFVNWVYNTGTGPIGSIARNVSRAIEDIQRGEYQRGVEAMLPAMLRNPLETIRFYKEGLETRDGKVIRAPEFYTNAKLIGEALGFGSTEIAEIRERNFQIKSIELSREAQRGELLAKLDEAAQAYEAAGYSDEAYKLVEDVMKEIVQFNMEFPWLYLTDESIERSLEGKAEDRGAAIEGLRINDRIAPLIFPLIEPNLRR